MKEKLLKKSNLWHVAAVAVFLVISCAYFYPALQGYSVIQDDTRNWIGGSQEAADFRADGEGEIGWTNSMFSGMPNTQISLAYEGKQVPDFFRNVISLWLPAPISILFVYFIGFYILSLSFRAKPLVAMIGAIAYGLSSYFIIIIQVGHVTKALAIGYAPLVLAGFIFAYRWKNWMWGVALSALFMSFQFSANHIQITYYLMFVLVGLGVVEFIRHLEQEKGIVRFFKITGGLLVAYIVALMINYGNIKGTQEYSEYTTRGGTELTINPDLSPRTGEGDGLDSEYITRWSYGKAETFTFLVPNYKGGLSQVIGSNKSNAGAVKSAEAGFRDQIKGSSQYWGDQPGTSGPVYVGCIVVLLALLSLYYSKDKARWALLVVTLLTIMLGWGKNFMGLTDLFINYFPGYAKFRAVTIILAIAELCIPLLGVLFLQRLIDARDEIAKNIKPFLYISGSVLFILFLFYLMPGVFNTFLSEQELAYMDELTTQRGVPAEQVSYVEDLFNALAEVRTSIFRSDVLRTFVFVLLGAGAIFAFLKNAFTSTVFGIALGSLILVDMILVDSRYLNTEKTGKNFRMWTETYKQRYPYLAKDGEAEILRLEEQENPILTQKIDSALTALDSELSGQKLSGSERQRLVDWTTFRTLNRFTNFRVYDGYNPYNSTYVSYFNKAIGGYHGAKLGRYQELVEFHLSRNNPAVFDMLNMKYTIIPQMDQENDMVIGSMLTGVNKNAMGNAWLAKDILVVKNADEEIMALQSERTYNVQSFGEHELLVNGKPDSSEVITEGDLVQLRFVMGMDSAGNKVDTLLDMQMPYSAVQADMPLAYVLTNQGIRWDYAMNVDSSTVPLLGLYLAGRKGWDPEQVTVVDERFKANLSGEKYSGTGTVKMTSYHPDHLTYSFSSTDKQLMVFSEIYYPIGWKAFVDGAEVPISRVNYVLRAIEVPAGDHNIELVYKLDSYQTSKTVAWTGSIIMILLFGAGFFIEARNKKTNTGE